MLQIVRDARRDVIGLPLQRKIAVIGAEIHGQKRKFPRKAGALYHAHAQAVGENFFKKAVRKLGICKIVHACTPLRKKIVSRLTRRAAAATSSFVTRATRSDRACIVSGWPAMIWPI